MLVQLQNLATMHDFSIYHSTANFHEYDDFPNKNIREESTPSLQAYVLPKCSESATTRLVSKVL